MKRLFLLVLLNIVLLPIFAQKYSKELKNRLTDSLSTNIEYVRNWCEEEIKKGEKEPFVYSLDALCSTQLNNYEDYVDKISLALKYCKKDEDLSPSALYYMRGLGYLALKDEKAALKDFNKSIKLDPDMLDPYKERVEIYFKNGKYELALNDIKKIIGAEPTYVNVLLLARYNIFVGNIEFAFNDLNMIINGDPSVLDAYLYRADLYKNLQKNQLAINDYIKYMSLSDSFNVEYLASICGQNESDFKYTISILSDLINNDKENFRWLLSRMCLYVINEQYDLAKKDLELFKNTFSEDWFKSVEGSYYYEKIIENTK